MIDLRRQLAFSEIEAATCSARESAEQVRDTLFKAADCQLMKEML
jgi:hypothetical protein